MAEERTIEVAEVAPMRARQYCCAVADRLDRVLAAALDQRPADEGHGRQSIERPELADRIGDIDVRSLAGELTRRALRHAISEALEILGDRRPAFRMTRRD